MRPYRLLAAVPVAVLLAAGCGGESTTGTGTPAASGSSGSASAAPAGQGIAALPAAEILTKATAALKAAKSVRIKGQGGPATSQFTIDMRYTGSDSTGTLGVNGQTVELRKLGQDVYIKGSRQFWTGNGGGTAAQLLADKWLKTPLTDKRFGGLAELTDLGEAADNLLDADGTITKGAEKAINGVPAVGLDSSGKDGGTLWVATAGEPYPLRIEPGAGSGQQGALDFLGYGESVSVELPPADQVIDVSTLPAN